jgi:cytidine deaminase
MRNSYDLLIQKATELSTPKPLTPEAVSGYAGSALVTEKGNIYTGKSLTGSCGIGFCGEVGAVLDMLKHGETRIEAVVTVSNDHKLMPPCGRCRELIYEIDRKNLDTEMPLEGNRVVKLRDIFLERWQELWEAE